MKGVVQFFPAADEFAEYYCSFSYAFRDKAQGGATSRAATVSIRVNPVNDGECRVALVQKLLYNLTRAFTLPFPNHTRRIYNSPYGWSDRGNSR